jgi:hypothetical protein
MSSRKSSKPEELGQQFDVLIVELCKKNPPPEELRRLPLCPIDGNFHRCHDILHAN